MPARDVELAEHTASTTTRRWLQATAAALVGACLVAVVAAGRPDEATSVRSLAATTSVPTSTASSEPAPAEAAETTTPRSTPDRTSRSADPAAAAVGPPATTVTATTTVATAPTVPLPLPPPAEAVTARPVPGARPASPPTGPATAYDTVRTPAGHVATDLGCASGTSAAALDAYFRERVGPVVGHDYQHVYPLGGDRHLWLFQDTFIDHTGNARRLDEAAFAHNTALLQDGRCFTLLHRGTPAAPSSFEPGTGEAVLSRWFWPLGGERSDGVVQVLWAEMVKTDDPAPPDGLGWVPARTWLAAYDATTLERTSFQPAPASGVDPIYGFAVASDDEHTYLFGNSFDQNLAHQGGYHGCPCSATAVFLARVPRGRLDVAPEYRTATGWSVDAAAAVPIVDRYFAENPMQPRFLDGRWVAVTKVDGYWGDDLAIDVAPDPWGPWTTAVRRPLAPRGGDPAMNTYHAHLVPWTNGGGLVVSVSQNARDMLRDAWPRPDRYRLQFLAAPMPAAPPPDVVPTTTPGTAPTTPTSAEPPGSTSPTTTAEPTTTFEPTTTTPPAPSTTVCATTTSSAPPTSSGAATTSTSEPC